MCMLFMEQSVIVRQAVVPEGTPTFSHVLRCDILTPTDNHSARLLNIQTQHDHRHP